VLTPSRGEVIQRNNPEWDLNRFNFPEVATGSKILFQVPFPLAKRQTCSESRH